ncbi:MAG: DEAD/DEAH box helicase [Gemmatimonadaceae bacterium]
MTDPMTTDPTTTDPTTTDATTSTEPADGFLSLGLDARLLAVLTELGYEEPTPIQREAIPALLAGRDLLGQAATGTGKTAAFALPLLQHIGANREGPPRTAALVLVPTRELAMQVAQAIHRYGKGMAITVLPIYGGQSIDQQLRVLKRGVDVVVATPGRALDHIRRRTLRLDAVRVVVLDEADEMLDMGFVDDLEAILDATPATRQTALFSATIPARIRAIAERYLTNPLQVAIAREQVQAGDVPRVRQTAYVVQRSYKLAALGRVLDVESPTATLVFCRTRTEVDELTEAVNGRGYRAEALHGGMSQEQRDRVMRRFRDGTVELVIATDVAARGLDIGHISHVINYDVPSAPETYVHRIGRTGRAGREGVAITLAEPREHRQLRNIEYLTKQKIEMATVPTVADLRARRLELTRASLREALVEGNLDRCRIVVEALAEEFDIVDIAAAAVKLAHAATGSGADDEEDIPTPPARRDRPGSADRGDRGAGVGARRRIRSDGDTEGERAAGRRPDRPERGRRVPRAGGKSGRDPDWNVARLYVGAGRKAGVRPGDLVGAITNEVGLDSWAIGAIEIADRFSLVEVPEEMVDDIIGVLRATTIKGKKVAIRRDRDAG